MLKEEILKPISHHEHCHHKVFRVERKQKSRISSLLSQLKQFRNSISKQRD
ncbi:hypothetical protein cbdbB1 [Dehalococcoides mccartyi CBDB1]|uniref:Uncharacterized protein n=1 Tax=Dehalococcoides mccartyi (strain CBDB1) TaxID=255470 RepID=A0A916KL76_DEHMC|nr:hypothetical protein dcmb_30 [Dehalococcoides mccartyi DCMB5]AGG07143.1 hypothetical protein btf_30 [Dehalococcoides mccartyi BTF08]AII60271.1 hypothetical protein X794_00155 [Dehalococcoides mccartyi CG5]CAI82309.1 hypothetical protein cbdbB1 [Dehalococcoides mccartyi CBDB1]